MIVFTIISILFTLLYAVLMMVYRRGWKTQPTFTALSNKLSTKISIIIPARNEEQNIGICLDAIVKQNYPKDLYEVIVIDDHSTDNTAGVVERYKDANIRCLKLADYPTDNTIAYKKKSLSIGIAASTGELILTTDADCFVGPNWLQNIAAIYEQEKPVMIVAPVDFTNDGSIVQLFQSLDFMSMQGITAASHKLKLGNMSNGANLAFSREAYNAVDGYIGIDHLASGDDYLLMMKIQNAYPDRISYLKSQEAIVHTAPQPDWNSFIQQRIRWASKSGKYDDKKLTSILAFVYLYNVLIFISGFVSFTHLYTIYSYSFFSLLFIKTIVELIYLAPVARFFNKRQELLYFPLLQPLHVLYIVSAGLLGFIGVYKWKGRKVK